MSMEKHTRIRDVVPQDDGALLVHIAQMVVEGDAVLGSRTHLLRIEPGDDIEQKVADVNAHFAAGLNLASPAMLGQGAGVSQTKVTYPALEAKDIDRVHAKAAEVWTSEVHAAWKAKRAAEKAQADADEQQRQSESKARARSGQGG